MKNIHLHSTIRNKLFLTASILGVISLTACERKATTEAMPLPVCPTLQPTVQVAPSRTFETAHLGAAIDTFERAPTVGNQSSVKVAFAKLDEKIAEQEDLMIKAGGQERAYASLKLNNLQTYRNSEMARFKKDLDGLALDENPPEDTRSAAQKAEDKAERVGEKVEDGAKKVGRTIGNAVRKTGEAISDSSQ